MTLTAPHPLATVFTHEQITDMRQRWADGYTVPQIAAVYGLPENSRPLIALVRHRGMYGPIPDPPRWQAACMTTWEWDMWTGPNNSRLTSENNLHPAWTARPCDDCPMAWAVANRAVGTCNGTIPGEHL